MFGGHHLTLVRGRCDAVGMTPGELLAQALKPMFTLAEQVTRETPAAAKRAGEAMAVLLEQRKR